MKVKTAFGFIEVVERKTEKLKEDPQQTGSMSTCDMGDAMCGLWYRDTHGS